MLTAMFNNSIFSLSTLNSIHLNVGLSQSHWPQALSINDVTKLRLFDPPSPLTPYIVTNSQKIVACYYSFHRF